MRDLSSHLDTLGSCPTRSRSRTTSRSPTQPIDLVCTVRAAMAGDLTAQSELIRAYQRRIEGFIASIVAERDSVPDLRQRVLIRMTLALPRLRDPAVFESWLFTLCRNACLDFIRKKRRYVVQGHDDEFWTRLPDERTAFQWHMLTEDVSSAIGHLASRDQALIRLVIDGQSHDDIARRQQTSRCAIKARLSRLRPVLRAFLRGSPATSSVASRNAA